MIEPTADQGRSVTALVRLGLAIVVPGEDSVRRLLITAAGRAAIATPKNPPPDTTLKSDDSLAAGPAPAPSKIARIVALLERPQGATLADLMAVTGWQAHSVRGAIAGAIKKKLGATVLSEKTGETRTYRIAGAEA